MKYFFLVIIITYIFLSPFYIFESGLPQPADFVIAFGCIFLFFSENFREYFKQDIVKKLMYFLAITITINLLYFLVYQIQGIDSSKMLRYIFYYSFNFLFFLLFLKTLKENESFSNYVSLAIIICLAIQTSFAALGINGGIKGDGARSILFFNNPNQLGYFSLLLLTIFTVIKSKYRLNFYYVFSILLFSSALILFSGSRAALGGLLILAIILLYRLGSTNKFRVLVFLIVVLIAAPFAYQTSFIQSKVSLIESRNQRNEVKNITEAQVRGYDRFWIHPEYVFFGAGEGKNDRFNSYHTLEMHSGFGTILFSYGILGFILFSLFLYKVIEKNTYFNILLLTPVLIYNLTHQGFRFSLFWALLACIFVHSESKNPKSIENQ